MLSDKENNDLLKYPNYLLSTYQLEIYKQLGLYMEENKLRKKDIAKQLKFSNSYISQILKGKFNFTLKKLIELGLAINKVPYLEFIDKDEYWRREKEGTTQFVVQSTTYHVELENSIPAADSLLKLLNAGFIDYKGGKLPHSVTKKIETVN